MIKKKNTLQRIEKNSEENHGIMKAKRARAK